MAKRIVTIDDIDEIEDIEDGYDRFDESECIECPDYKKCRNKVKVASAWVDIEMFFEKLFFAICRGIFVAFKPVFNAINKRRGGTECRACHVYIVDPGEYCGNCGKSFATGKRLHDT